MSFGLCLVFVISLQPLRRCDMTAECVRMDSTFSLSVSSWIFVAMRQITSLFKQSQRVALWEFFFFPSNRAGSSLTLWVYGTWRVFMDLLEGARWRWRWVAEWGSVNSPPCIMNRHAGAALCAVLTSPTEPLLTFPHSAGGCGSQCWLFLHFIQVRSDLLSLVKHWRLWPPVAPSLPANVKITQAALQRASAASARCYEIALASFVRLNI